MAVYPRFSEAFLFARADTASIFQGTCIYMTVSNVRTTKDETWNESFV